MKCYDCGTEVAGGAVKCPKCYCPTERKEAQECLQKRLATARETVKKSYDRLPKGRSALYVSSMLAIGAAVIVLLNDIQLMNEYRTQEVGFTIALDVALLLIALGMGVAAYFFRKKPIAVFGGELVMSLFFFRSPLFVLILGMVAVSALFGVPYRQAMRREENLKEKLDELK